MKIIFTQLPLIDHGYFYLQGNVSYASATQMAYLKKNFRNIECEILPFVLENFASNQMICKYILRTNPDVVAFTNFLWNSERHLTISKLLKEKNPKLKIFFGGAEIHQNSWLLSKRRPSIDCFINGEGEWFFKKLLTNQDLKSYEKEINGNKLCLQPKTELLPAQEIVEPFTANYLNTMLDNSIFLEMMRGCPYGCVYCNYSKNMHKIRDLSFQLLLDAIDRQKTFNLSEIYILAPTFSKTADFREKLKILAKKNSTIKLHTELRAEDIDEELAKLLYEAGFRSLEVGLQTTNPTSLKKINRRSNPQKEIEGMKILINQGIDLKIGVIPGLPGDSASSFEKMLLHLADQGMSDFLEIYPLMVLPGTKVREMADKEKINYQKKPPYFYLEGWDCSIDDQFRIRNLAAEISGYTTSITKLPDLIFDNDNGLFCNSFYIEDLTTFEIESLHQIIETNVATIFVKNFNNSLKIFLSFVQYLLKQDELFNFVIENETLIDNLMIIDFILANEPDSLYRRMHFFEEWTDGLRLKFYQLFHNLDSFKKAEKDYSLIEPIFYLTEKNIKQFLKLEIDEDFQPAILIPKNEYQKVREKLPRVYQEYTERVTFETENDCALFYQDAGIEYNSLPFKFSRNFIKKS